MAADHAGPFNGLSARVHASGSGGRAASERVDGVATRRINPNRKANMTIKDR